MASPPRKSKSRPSRPSKAHARHTADREERKERGTPEKSRTRRHRTESPERSASRPRKERTPQKRRNLSPERDHKSKKKSVSDKHESYESSNSGTALLSSNALAQLDALNEKTSGGAKVKEREKRERVYSEKRTVKEGVVNGKVEKQKPKKRRRSDGHYERRRISGPLAEEGRAPRRRKGDYIRADEGKRKKRFGRRFWIGVGILLLILVIAIPVGVVVAGKKSSSGGGLSGDPSNGNLNGVSQDSIPTAAKNTILDPFTWYDTTDFNVTYTNTTFGGLPIMGLNSTWNDSTQANSIVPALDKKWAYGTMPIRGVNLGGWLSLEPFITPSLFNTYQPNENIVDEWTLTTKLGPSNAASTLEKHYSQFITEQDFADIQAAGFDHVRIPYSYWAITTYSGDPYVPKISWRYLLRGIEYARKYGLRVNLDLHGLPGSQNGWNHSGRQGTINWLNGTDGATNAQRSLDLHTQIATFFAQPRYANIIAIYGLVNEPKMTELSVPAVVQWTTSAVQNVRKAGMNCTIAFGDGFLGLTKWQGQLQGIPGLVLDAHEYVIFDPNQIALNHTAKVQYACTGWTDQMQQSTDTTTARVYYPLWINPSLTLPRFGPTLCGEWSQADTDCTTYLNNVGAGTRWEGTLQSTQKSQAVLTPSCPSKSSQCSCSQANADPSSYSGEYKQWLMMNAEGQMSSFEKAWGWFYWTWTTEGATQWDYKAGMANGILPKTTWQRTFNCTSNIPDFGGSGLSENY